MWSEAASAGGVDEVSPELQALGDGTTVKERSFLFVQPVSISHMLHARHCSRSLGYIGVQSRLGVSLGLRVQQSDGVRAGGGCITHDTSCRDVCR